MQCFEFHWFTILLHKRLNERQFNVTQVVLFFYQVKIRFVFDAFALNCDQKNVFVRIIFCTFAVVFLTSCIDHQYIDKECFTLSLFFSF